MSASQYSLLQLRVVSEADPSALVRVLQQFQNLNFVPRRVVAECSTTGLFHLRVDVFGITEERLTLIAEKVGQIPCVFNSYWCRT